MGGGRSVPLDVQASETISSLKQKIWAKERIPPDRQELRFGVKVLENQYMLKEYGIGSEADLRLGLGGVAGGTMNGGVVDFVTQETKQASHTDNFQVFYQDMGGRSVPLDVQASETISSLKRKIWVKEGVPPDRQELRLGGRLLDNKCTLKDCDIVPESNIR